MVIFAPGVILYITSEETKLNAGGEHMEVTCSTMALHAIFISPARRMDVIYQVQLAKN